MALRSELEEKITAVKRKEDEAFRLARATRSQRRALEEALRTLRGQPKPLRPHNRLLERAQGILKRGPLSTVEVAERLLKDGYTVKDNNLTTLANITRNVLHKRPDLFEWDAEGRVWKAISPKKRPPNT